MSANIRHYGDNTTAKTDQIDPRTTAFMEAVRQRVTNNDHKQRLEWENARKTPASRKLRPVPVKPPEDDGGAEMDDDPDA